ncbi:biliverdin-producing heme oxygenase [Acidobacteria bacterium AB60]|nr:biliverdin-producing heme oxygenase [Acidobacteria bacterium AB60]
MNLAELRRETRHDHDEVEGALPLMDAGLNLEFYRAVLWRLLGLVEAWEQSARLGLPERLDGMVAERSRMGLLRRDLEDLGVVGKDVPQPRLPAFENLAEMLGAMYVMEGSRLGGQLIARHVEAVLGLHEGAGSRFFRGFGEETGARWKEFLGVLATEVAEEETLSAIRGAKKMFGAFGGWMRAAR